MRRANRRNGVHEVRPGGNWMVTFVDLVSLLLAFFVLLFSMTTPDAPQWESFTASLRSAFSKEAETRGRLGSLPETIAAESIGVGHDLGYLRRVLDTAMAKDRALQDATVSERSGRLVLSMPSDVFFAGGSADLLEAGESALFNLAEALSVLDNRIDIVGHTDPRPILGSGGPYSSNWDLSLARAVSVAHMLEKFGYRKPLEIRGAADGKYDELDEDMTDAERFRRARRVDLVIYRERDRG